MTPQIHYDEVKGKWYRFCPICNKQVYHSTKKSGEVCIKNSRSCLKCLPTLTKCSVCGKHGHTKRFHNPVPTKKECPMCKKILSLEGFYYVKRRRSGKIYYSYFCKECDVKNQKERFNSSPEKRAIILLNSARSKCKKERISFSITAQDLMNLYKSQNGKCYYSGKQMSYKSGDKDIMSVDRIDPHSGYTKKNIVLCCWRVNEMKKDYPQNDFLSLCKQIYDFSNNRCF